MSNIPLNGREMINQLEGQLFGDRDVEEPRHGGDFYAQQRAVQRTPGTPAKGHDERSAQADRLRANARSSIAAIEQDQSLTFEAKQKRIADVRAETNRSIDALLNADRKSMTDEKAQLEHKLCSPPALPFGATPSDRIARDASYRDALDRARAASAKDGGLREMYKQAMLVGDELQTRAVLATAMTTGNIEAINLYIDDHPEDDVPLQRLFDLTHAVSNTASQLKAALEFQGL